MDNDTNDDSTSQFQDTSLDDLIEMAKNSNTSRDEALSEFIAKGKLIPQEALVDALNRIETLEVLVYDAIDQLSAAPPELRRSMQSWLSEARAATNPSPAS